MVEIFRDLWDWGSFAVKESPVGEERQVDISGGSEPRVHGVLTAFLVGLLEKPDISSLAVEDFASALSEVEGFDPIVKLAHAPGMDASRSGTPNVFFHAGHLEAIREITMIEQQPIRAVLTAIEAELAEREAQDDPWPEGRLNAGIAYAAMGDYARARALLQDAVDIFSGRGIHDAAAMAM